ncbi:MAG TPA: prepilin-type N-terminal cleavage/methylation domain-containing protein, partial [Gemmataceae bacterium]|nr:prepilin-type N-terminal cleavage/methylation domain-containing protein [Gemmataceae bacterium]
MTRRRGITLMEVLVAIFIMAIGLLAILTLFPLGALRMGEALQSDRTASAGSAGANICDGFNIRSDPTFYTQGGNNWYLGQNLQPPNGGLPGVAANGSGYPLYVDPYGVANGSGPVGGDIPRVVPSIFLPPYATLVNPGPPPVYAPIPSMIAARYFTLLDDLTFLDNGQPDQSSNNVQRVGRYTWAYMLHRSQPASPNSLVDLNIVVYAGRTVAVPGGENSFGPLVGNGTTAVGNIGDTNISLAWPNGVTAPNIKRGSWILDSSTDWDPVSKVQLGVHGLFYRVVALNQPSNNVMNLEVQVPLAK